MLPLLELHHRLQNNAVFIGSQHKKPIEDAVVFADSRDATSTIVVDKDIPVATDAQTNDDTVDKSRKLIAGPW